MNSIALDPRILTVIEKTYGNCSDISKNVGNYLPLILVKSFLFKKRAISLPFMDVGCIYPKLTGDKLVHLKKELSKEKKLKHLEIRLNNSHNDFSDISKLLLKEGFLEVGAKEQFYIRIEDPLVKWDKFHKHTRNDIRKSEKSNLTLKSINDLIELKNFYKLYFKEMKRFGTPCHSFKFFKNLMESFKDDFCGINCYFDGNLIASGILILENEVSYLWFNVSNLKYREYRPNDLIYWTFIKKAHERGVKWIDVGQVDINSSESHAKGLFSFKNKWLGEVYERKYFVYSFDKHDSDNVSKKNKLKKFRNVWSKLPGFLIKIIGPRICSQLGV